MDKVEVFVIGVQKCGTTTLHDYLSHHTSFSIPSTKELHFFDDESIDWSNPDYASYENNFEGEGIRFESTPIYIFWPNAIERIHKYNPDAKLIAIFRNPIERAFSHWNMNRVSEFDRKSFSYSIRDTSRLNTDDGLRTHSYLQRSMYGQQCERLLKVFPREQVHFMKLEEFDTQSMFEFLGVEPIQQKDMRLNANEYTDTISNEDKEYLVNALKDDMKLFNELTGIHWRIV